MGMLSRAWRVELSHTSCRAHALERESNTSWHTGLASSPQSNLHTGLLPFCDVHMTPA